jgi:type IV pilus assembly protein PilA
MRGRATEPLWAERGLTMVELLVVMLILALLAAIAVPIYLNQRDKGSDTVAKQTVRAAVTALEVYGDDHHGSYAEADGAALHQIESAIPSATAVSVPATDPPGEYSVTVTSEDGNSFRLTRLKDGTLTSSCTTAGTGGCPPDGQWLKG